MSHLVMVAPYQPGDIYSLCPGYMVYRSEDGLNWRAQDFFLSDDQYTHRGLAITEFTDIWLGGKKGLCLTLVTGNNTIFTYISFDDGNTWKPSPILPEWRTQSGISSVFWDNRLYLVVVGLFGFDSNAGIYVTSSADPTKPDGWPNPERLISKHWKTNVEGSLVVYNQDVWAGMIGLNGDIVLAQPQPNSPVIHIPLDLTRPVSPAVFKGQFCIAMIRRDRKVYVISSPSLDPRYVKWSGLTNPITVCPLPESVSLIAFEDKFLCLAVTDYNYRTIYTRVSTDGETWTGLSSPISSPPIFPVLSPSAMSISSIN